MVGEIFAGLQAFKSILDSAKALADMHDEGVRLRATNDLLRQINAAEQNYAAALDRVRALEAEIAEIKARKGDLERYELKGIGGGAAAYMLKPEARGAEPPHWLCPACYANGKKAILQRTVQTGHGHLYTCGGCSAKTVVGWGEPQWL